MKRVASELDALNGPEKEPNKEFLILQAVRFAFRVHQVYFIISFVSHDTKFECSKCNITVQRGNK